MKRLLRRTFVATSLLLCLVSLTLWVRSYFVREDVDFQAFLADDRSQPPHYHWHMYALGWGHGAICFFRTHQEGETKASARAKWSWNWNYHRMDPKISYLVPTSAETRLNVEVAGYQLNSRLIVSKDTGPNWVHVHWWSSEQRLSLPLWLFMVFGVPPLLWWRRRRCARLREGGCVVCGYDLRATPERCPECGGIPQRMTEAG